MAHKYITCFGLLIGTLMANIVDADYPTPVEDQNQSYFEAQPNYEYNEGNRLSANDFVPEYQINYMYDPFDPVPDQPYQANTQSMDNLNNFLEKHLQNDIQYLTNHYKAIGLKFDPSSVKKFASPIYLEDRKSYGGIADWPTEQSDENNLSPNTIIGFRVTYTYSDPNTPENSVCLYDSIDPPKDNKCSGDTFYFYRWQCPNGYSAADVNNGDNIYTRKCVMVGKVGIGGDLVFNYLNFPVENWSSVGHVGMVINKNPICDSNQKLCDPTKSESNLTSDSEIVEILPPTQICPDGNAIDSKNCNPVNSQSVVYTTSYSSFANPPDKFIGEYYNPKNSTITQDMLQGVARSLVEYSEHSGFSSEYSLGFPRALHDYDLEYTCAWSDSIKNTKCDETSHAVFRDDYAIKIYLDLPFSIYDIPSEFTSEFKSTQKTLGPDKNQKNKKYYFKKNQVNAPVTVEDIINDDTKTEYTFKQVVDAFTAFDKQQMARDDKFNLLWKGLLEFTNDPIIGEAIIEELSWFKPLEFYEIIITKYNSLGASEQDLILKELILRVMGSSLSVTSADEQDLKLYHDFLANDLQAQQGYATFKNIIDNLALHGHSTVIRYMLDSTPDPVGIQELVDKGYVTAERFYNMLIAKYMLNGNLQELINLITSNTKAKQVFINMRAQTLSKQVPRNIKDYIFSLSLHHEIDYKKNKPGKLY